MPRYTLLLIRCRNLAWDGLRRALDVMPDIRIVGDVQDAGRATLLAGELQPQLIVIGAAIAGNRSVIELIRTLREQSPASRVVVIVGQLDQVSAEELLTLHGLGIEGQLMWSEVTEDRFHRCLLTVAEDGYVVGSRRVAEAFLDALRHLRKPPQSPPLLTEREQAVLKGLVAGLTHSQIAEELTISMRSVERTIESLEQELQVTTPARMIAKASLLGLVPWEWVAE